MIALMISGRLVARTDQRFMLIGGCLLNAVAATMMTGVTLGMDYWSLAWPRFLQGFAMGFVFPPLQTLTLATIRVERLGNATAAYNVVRNIGGSIGVALATTLLVRRSQSHQTTLVDPSERLGPRHDGEALAVDQPLREPGRRHVHGQPPGARHALPRRPSSKPRSWPTPTTSG